MPFAQVAPLHEAVPTRFYDGTERVVSYLAENLVQLSDDVMLFASSDSETRARLFPICEQALRLDPDCQRSSTRSATARRRGPWQRGGPAHADRLAGAVRTGRDRSHCLRTPVIAFPFGSMPEPIEPGVNGALVESVDQAVAAVEALAALDRRLCRRSFEERFTAPLMARDYVRVYEELVQETVSSAGRAALPEQSISSPVPAPVAAELRQHRAWLDQASVNGSRLRSERRRPSPKARSQPLS